MPKPQHLPLNDYLDIARRVYRKNEMNESIDVVLEKIHDDVCNIDLDCYDDFRTINYELSEEVREVGLEEISISLPEPVGFPIRMADILIDVLALCDAYSIDIEQALRQRLAYLESR